MKRKRIRKNYWSLAGNNNLRVFIFAVLWAFSYSFGLQGTIPCLFFCQLILAQSQYSTDTRDFWAKLISPDPQSLALAVMGGVCLLWIFVGSRISTMKSIEQSNRKYKFILFLSSASAGILLAYTINFAI